MLTEMSTRMLGCALVGTSALIRRANSGIRVVTQRAPPQGHESVGGVERAVRSLKELFSTVRLDLRAQGYDIKRSPRAFELG